MLIPSVQKIPFVSGSRPGHCVLQAANENEAAAYLQMCGIMMNKREFRASKDFFRKAKALCPTTPQIVDQIKQFEKYISRMPG